MSDLSATITMFQQANVNHRYWAVQEREDGQVFQGTCLVVGTPTLFGPYVEYLFDIYGKLVRVSPTQQTPDNVLIARTENDTVSMVGLLEKL